MLNDLGHLPGYEERRLRQAIEGQKSFLKALPFQRLISRPVSTPYSRPYDDVLENYLHDQVFPQAEVEHNENNSSLEFKVPPLP